MKFSIGYQYPDSEESERFPEIVTDYRKSLAEVYFAPGNEPGARTPAAEASGFAEDEAAGILIEDLKAVHDSGLRLNMLLNANCYGADCIAKETAKRVCTLTAYYRENVNLESVTTASIFIASLLKKEFPELKIRASVNMKLGTVEALEYAAEYFDSFCIQRDINYHMNTLKNIAKWARRNEREICLLANSGCLRNCAGQIFHDNLVAHIREMKKEECCMNFEPVFCRKFYASEKHRLEWLAHSTIIRPEDTFRYKSITGLMKLATRTHANPRLVIDAYSRGRFTGNLLDLTEPGHGLFFQGEILDNTLIPLDYWEKRTHCAEICRRCGYCSKIMESSLIRCEDYAI